MVPNHGSLPRVHVPFVHPKEWKDKIDGMINEYKTDACRIKALIKSGTESKANLVFAVFWYHKITIKCIEAKCDFLLHSRNCTLSLNSLSNLQKQNDEWLRVHWNFLKPTGGNTRQEKLRLRNEFWFFCDEYDAQWGYLEEGSDIGESESDTE